MGEGLAFVKLWPLDAKTGARTPSLRTGFRPSPISEVASRTSATGGGMNIEILAGADGLAAVAKAKAAAEAAASSARAPLERSWPVPASVRASSPPSSLSSPPGSPAEIVDTAPDGAGLGASAAAVSGSDVGNGAGESSSRQVSSVVDDNAADNISIEAMPEAAATGEAGRAAAGEKKEATAAAPRWLALEVEVFAVGGINVPYMMFLITVCFEQVCVARVSAVHAVSTYEIRQQASRAKQRKTPCPGQPNAFYAGCEGTRDSGNDGGGRWLRLRNHRVGNPIYHRNRHKHTPCGGRLVGVP